MIPKINDELMADFEEAIQQPSKTYKLDLERKRVIGYVDGREAIEQFIYKTLSTERYDHIIYSWDYGAEIAQLFGKPIPFVYSELKRLITEALTQDDRIESVDAFSFEKNKSKVLVKFTARTTEGEIEAESEVVV
ncbi:DUF2634 domain-containing protein [Psychrobacillus sp. NEAU-3TGS]|uniref:DUF2634 domain-containing protein n=1 Tax=Psychrobacillus sp. NEAU-3TGS TaxID=2995412 RepID=UPI00249766DD|nr:DUF2634 domain-containing protein [Psychrobacillus sp. NEAU-3TGS]MDI2588037.1 DUF2634 domain-containing protein [Psychrobacillus sp. NEAU-3TGS]